MWRPYGTGNKELYTFITPPNGIIIMDERYREYSLHWDWNTQYAFMNHFGTTRYVISVHNKPFEKCVK